MSALMERIFSTDRGWDSRIHIAISKLHAHLEEGFIKQKKLMQK